jgi:hypothetical protein
MNANTSNIIFISIHLIMISFFILENLYYNIKNDNIYIIIYRLSVKNDKFFKKYREIVNIHINNYTYNKVIY